MLVVIPYIKLPMAASLLNLDRHNNINKSHVELLLEVV